MCLICSWNLIVSEGSFKWFYSARFDLAISMKGYAGCQWSYIDLYPGYMGVVCLRTWPDTGVLELTWRSLGGGVEEWGRSPWSHLLTADIYPRLADEVIAATLRPSTSQSHTAWRANVRETNIQRHPQSIHVFQNIFLSFEMLLSYANLHFKL